MILYLMQHGRPVAKEEDPERPLSEKGSDDVKRMAGFLKEHGVRVDEVLHSGKTRARQTAEIMISRLNPGARPIEKGGLSPMDDVRDIAEQIRGRERDLMITGHLPHLARLASFLVTGSESIPIVSFQQGGIVCLSRDENREWSIAWMLVPEII